MAHEERAKASDEQGDINAKRNQRERSMRGVGERSLGDLEEFREGIQERTKGIRKRNP